MRMTVVGFGAFSALLVLFALAGPSSAEAPAQTPKTLAFLGLRFENDNQALEPTTPAEQARIKATEEEFKARADASGQYKIMPLAPQTMSKLSSGQPPGTCSGCEIAYAKEAGSEAVAWMTVQKVSNLILNMNLYVGDVETGKLTFVHSVDIRGNTDESWHRSLNYLLDNYLFAPASQ